MPLLREDPELLSAFRAGERHALGRIYRFYARDIERYLRALARETGAGDLAQTDRISDLIQQAFVNAFGRRARHSYDAERPFTPYLKRIARNCFIDALRKRRRERLIPPESIPLDEPDGFDAREGFDPRALQILERYLAALSEPLLQVYEERFVRARSQADACEALGLSRGQLRTLENRLRTGLRRALRDGRLRGTSNQRAGAAEEKVLRTDG